MLTQKLIVLNISGAATRAELFELFNEYGKIFDIKIARDVSTGRCKGFAYIEMLCLNDAERASTGLNRSIYKGRLIVVKKIHTYVTQKIKTRVS